MDTLLGVGPFDAVKQLTQAFPLSVVCDMIGIPQEDRGRLLPWASALFDGFGPPNERWRAAQGPTQEVFTYAFSPDLPSRLLPGSAGAHIFAAVGQGRLTYQQGATLMVAYLAAALDTTISSLQHVIHLLGQNESEWRKLRARPELIPDAYNEALRLGTPVRGFCRVATEPYEFDGVRLNAGARVLLLFAAANRDPRAWNEPDKFDISRGGTPHLSFGHGVHLCAGAALARLEGHCMLDALVRKVSTIQIHSATPTPNNMIHAYGELQISLHR
ncbi:cytochrome P450 [Bradyrhizobium sp. CCGUVB14]|uniref:cytochrome P450 n=1 Tax=Bradyrhizobium sp. CCGUVB14 TaxID=2949628 RepID=UPI0020B3A2DD|nr:cytochrome P450 [Bradyrhizobium sp. CCGUVB14]MCP3440673.1 cytochrome P450 [Bradyrhizobium sp. CCGUVB14]